MIVAYLYIHIKYYISIHSPEQTEQMLFNAERCYAHGTLASRYNPYKPGKGRLDLANAYII